MTNIINFPIRKKKEMLFEQKFIEDPHVFTFKEGRTLFSWGFWIGIAIGIIAGLIFSWFVF